MVWSAWGSVWFLLKDTGYNCTALSQAVFVFGVLWLRIIGGRKVAQPARLDSLDDIEYFPGLLSGEQKPDMLWRLDSKSLPVLPASIAAAIALEYGPDPSKSAHYRFHCIFVFSDEEQWVDLVLGYEPPASSSRSIPSLTISEGFQSNRSSCSIIEFLPHFMDQRSGGVFQHPSRVDLFHRAQRREGILSAP